VTRARSATGYVIGGVGIAALVVGGIFLGRGVAYGSQSDDESAKAKGFAAPNPNGSTFAQAASADKSAGTTNVVVGAVAGGVGLVGVAVGLYFILTAPAKEGPSAATKGAGLRFTPDVGAGHVGGSASVSF
jgi:hypothetical protein